MSRETKEIIEELSGKYFHFDEYGERLVKAEAIPLIERKGLKDVSHVLQFNGYLLRPLTDSVDGHKCTYENVLNNLICRMELLRWVNDDGTCKFSAKEPKEVLSYDVEGWRENWNPSRFAARCREMMERRRADHNKEREENGLMLIPSYNAGSFAHLLPYPIRCRPSDNVDYVAFTILGKDTNELTALDAIKEAFPSEEDREAVLDAYNDMKVFLKAMAATYRLFATEQWDSIKDEEENTIKTALDNYFYHWQQDKQLAKHYKIANAKYEPKYKAKIDGTSALTYVCKVMRIPSEWVGYIKNGKLSKQKEAKERTLKVSTDFYNSVVHYGDKIEDNGQYKIIPADGVTMPQDIKTGIQLSFTEARLVFAMLNCYYNENSIHTIKIDEIEGEKLTPDEIKAQGMIRAYKDTSDGRYLSAHEIFHKAYRMDAKHSQKDIEAIDAKLTDLSKKIWYVDRPNTYIGKNKKTIVKVKDSCVLIKDRYVDLISGGVKTSLHLFSLSEFAINEFELRFLPFSPKYFDNIQIAAGSSKISDATSQLSLYIYGQICLNKKSKDKVIKISYPKLVCICQLENEKKYLREERLNKAINVVIKMGMVKKVEEEQGKKGNKMYSFTLNTDYVI